MSKVTKREKILISILIFIALVYVLGNYLVLPAYNRTLLKSEELAGLQMTKSSNMITIGTKETVENRISDLKLSQSVNESFYSEIMVNEDLDRLFTGMAVASGVLPSKLDIEPSVVSEEITSVLDVMTVTFHGTGTVESFNSFIDKVNEIPYVSTSSLKITSAGYSIYVPTQPSVIGEPVVYNTMIFVFKIYMLK